MENMPYSCTEDQFKMSILPKLIYRLHNSNHNPSWHFCRKWQADSKIRKYKLPRGAKTTFIKKNKIGGLTQEKMFNITGH